MQSERPRCPICQAPIIDDDGTRTRKGGAAHAYCLEQARLIGARSQNAGTRAPGPTPASRSRTAEVPSHGSGLTAKRPGRCPICNRFFGVGTPLGQCLEGRWGHASCAGAEQAAAWNKALILSGETYRSRTSTTWRRGKSPGSSRGKS